jgi:hypothetical protein
MSEAGASNRTFYCHIDAFKGARHHYLYKDRWHEVRSRPRVDSLFSRPTTGHRLDFSSLIATPCGRVILTECVGLPVPPAVDHVSP